MFIPLNQKRETLRIGKFAAAGIESAFYRKPAGTVHFRFEDLHFGFSLNSVTGQCGGAGADGLQEMSLEAGRGWIVPAGSEGQCAWNEPNDLMLVKIGAEAFARIDHHYRPEKIRSEKLMEDPLLVQLAISFHESQDMTGEDSAVYRDTLATAIAAHVLKHYGAEATDTVADPGHEALDKRIARVIHHIEKSAAANISLEALAGIAGMSSYYFARSFKKAVGQPPHKFIASKRMAEARDLLGKTDLPIAEIAYRVGYRNVSHFARIFRQHAGLTPGQFRQE